MSDLAHVTDVPLEPIECGSAKRPIRKVVLAMILGAGVVVGVGVARHLEQRSPHFVPTMLPGELSADRGSWIFTRSPPSAYAYGTDYGLIGADGRLDRWMQMRTTTHVVPDDPDRVINGRSLWFFPGAPSEIRAVIDIDGCGRFWIMTRGIDGDEALDAFGGAGCEDGYPIIEPFAGMQMLCRTSESDDVWTIEVPPIDAASNTAAYLGASRDDCPLATWSGNSSGRERYATINGVRTFLLVNGEYGYGAASFRIDHHTITLEINLAPRADADLEAQLISSVEHLQQLSSQQWHLLTPN